MANDRANETLFRNFLPGLKGRRDDLLRRRRDELATMPHALRRIYVARVARVSATLAASLGGATRVAVAATPSAQVFLARLMPGQTPAVLSTLLLGTLVLSALAYLLGRCIAEARFTKAMATCVLPGTESDDELSRDVERLRHIRPDQLASTMIRQFESPAAALPPAAVALALPCALAYGLMALMRMGYPLEADVDASFANNASTLLSVGGAGVAAAIFLTWTRNRSQVRRTTLIATTLSGFVAIVASVFLGASLPLVIAGTAAVTSAIALSLVIVRQEQSIVLLENSEDSLWTVGMAWEQLRALVLSARQELTFAKFRAALRRPLIRRVVVLGGIASVLLYGYRVTPTGTPPPQMKHASRRVIGATPLGQLEPPQLAGLGEQLRLQKHVQTSVLTSEVALAVAEGVPSSIPALSRRPLLIPAGYDAMLTIEVLGFDGPPASDLAFRIGGDLYPTATRLPVASSEKARAIYVIADKLDEGRRQVRLRYQLSLTSVVTP